MLLKINVAPKFRKIHGSHHRFEQLNRYILCMLVIHTCSKKLWCHFSTSPVDTSCDRPIAICTREWVAINNGLKDQTKGPEDPGTQESRAVPYFSKLICKRSAPIQINLVYW